MWDAFGPPDSSGALDAPPPPPPPPPPPSDEARRSALARAVLPLLAAFLAAHAPGAAADLAALGDVGSAAAAGVGALLEAAAGAGAATAPSPSPAAPSPSSSAPARAAAALAAVGGALAASTFATLQARGGWPHVCFREAHVCAQLGLAVGSALTPPPPGGGPPPASASAAAAVELGDAAMRAVDMAYVMGAPPREISDLAQCIEAECLARRAAAAAAAASAGVAGGASPGAPPAPDALPVVPPILVEGALFSLPAGLLDGSGRRVPRARGRPAAGAGDRARLYVQPSGEAAALAALRAVPPAPALSAADFRARHVARGEPVVLAGAAADWPALARWRDLRALSRRAGHRTVPVELGHHLRAGWREAPSRLDNFIRDALAPSVAAHWGASRERPPPEAVAYVAQHGLLSQVPALAEDVRVPPYAGSRDGEVGAVNVWLGTAGTVTRCHFDSYENLLVQVFGYKLVRLFAPADGPRLYPIAAGGGGGGARAGGAGGTSATADGGSNTTAQGNVAGVDVEDAAAGAPDGPTPLFALAQPVDALLGPGDALFIPRGWWHYVRALTPSASVNFWWTEDGEPV